jgi:predicted XRE-type DNA-binding protein
MEKRRCLKCCEFKIIGSFMLEKGKKGDYRRAICNTCRNKKYHPWKKKPFGRSIYDCRFNWSKATKEEKRIHILKVFEKNTQLQKNGCLFWTNKLIKKGYGAVQYEGKSMSAHRVSWIINNGPIPEGMCVLHICDQPACVKISHLFLGTPKDNVHDMYKKGRKKVTMGEAHFWTKLKEEEVAEIKKMLKKKEKTQKQIAHMFNVSRGAISDIALNRNWKHVKI